MSIHLGKCEFFKVLILMKSVALRKSKIVYRFGLSECNRIKDYKFSQSFTVTT